MEVFLVNLNRHADRLVAMDAQLSSMGIRYVHMPAVDGRLLTSQEKRQKFSSVHSFFAMNRFLRNAEIGCALSHVSVYHRMCVQAIESAVILEDDLVIDPCFPDVLKNVFDFVDVSKPQVVMLSNFGFEQEGRRKTGIERSPKSLWCTDAYVITLPAARIIERENFPVVTIADCWHRWEESCGVEMYRVFPTTIRQNRSVFPSSVQIEVENPFWVRAYLRIFSSMNRKIDGMLSQFKRMREM